MSLRLLFFVLAAIFFGLAAFRVNGPLDWNSAGFACVTIGVFLT